LIAKEQAELANRAKSEFLATMSDELRMPLNAVIDFAETLELQILGPLGNPRYLEYAKDIKVSSRHLLDLFSDVLGMSAIEAGKVDLRKDNVNVSEAIEACWRLMKGQAEEGKLALSFDLADGFPGLRADERRLKQILLNLLSNAIKFTPAGGKVHISAGLGDDGSLNIAVADNGIGMKAEDIAKAMSAFGQVKNGYSGKFSGTGLGIPLSKHFAELHGAAFDIDTVPGAGTTVTVRFPALRVINLDLL
ncbi:MAG: HAMP domain-containing sensor histidine kinase, partial [Rhodospirillales bacterium]